MNNLNRNKKQILNIVFKYISKDDCAIFLFGSFAKNRIYPSSDIDVGIVCKAPLQNSTLVKIKEDLEGIKTLRDIDVVDFSSMGDDNFLRIALKEVKVWHQTKKSRIYLDNLRKLIAG